MRYGCVNTVSIPDTGDGPYLANVSAGIAAAAFAMAITGTVMVAAGRRERGSTTVAVAPNGLAVRW